MWQTGRAHSVQRPRKVHRTSPNCVSLLSQSGTSCCVSNFPLFLFLFGKAFGGQDGFWGDCFQERAAIYQFHLLGKSLESFHPSPQNLPLKLTRSGGWLGLLTTTSFILQEDWTGWRLDRSEDLLLNFVQNWKVFLPSLTRPQKMVMHWPGLYGSLTSNVARYIVWKRPLGLVNRSLS